MIHGTQVLAFVMAGGAGSRLHPLTAHECKPALPFGGRHRVVDFVMGNLLNSGVAAVQLLVQYQPQTLLDHVAGADKWLPADRRCQVNALSPPHGGRFLGTADAVYKSLDRLGHLAGKPDYVAVFGADHIYRMDVRQMLDFHITRGADATVATLPVPLSLASAFGVVGVDPGQRIVTFSEKPQRADDLQVRPGIVQASMGNYIFSADVLWRELAHCMARGETDFGQHVLPRLLGTHNVMAYDFHTNRMSLRPGEERGYWRDVGTIDAYFLAHFDTMGAAPKFRLDDPAWPLPCAMSTEAPALVRGAEVKTSSVGPGTIVDRSWIDHAVLGSNVRIERGARVERSIVMEGARVGAGTRLRNVIVDRGAVIPAGASIGYDTEQDRARFHVSEAGVVVVARDDIVNDVTAPPAARAVERESSVAA